ncbi:MAG: hypothetical protein ACFB2X_25530 [Rivularia sp. (in: cyanobacteria)]
MRESKIAYKSSEIHPLARFVTEEAVCLKFNIKFEDIYIVECWQYIVYVHAKGVSKFVKGSHKNFFLLKKFLWVPVSYADFPPIIGVKPPSASEMAKWCRRWLKQHDFANRKHAPKWWAQFFTNQFEKAPWEKFLYDWGKLIRLIKFAFNEEILQDLRESYRQARGIARGVLC